VKEVVSIGVGDLKVAKASVIFSTCLGSCVAVCLYSSTHKAGGMLHFMLPQSGPSKDGAVIRKAKYADTGIPELLYKLKVTFNLEKEHFVAKLFGGANILTNFTHRIGSDNIKAAQDVIKELGIPLRNSRVGGERGYRVDFDLNTGKVFCRVFGEPVKEY
jgi:chemotaxis protein CheD